MSCSVVSCSLLLDIRRRRNDNRGIPTVESNAKQKNNGWRCSQAAGSYLLLFDPSFLSSHQISSLGQIPQYNPNTHAQSNPAPSAPTNKTIHHPEPYPQTNKPTNMPPPQLSAWEKLDLIPGYLSIIGTVLYSAIAGGFRGKSGARLYSVHVFHAAVRKMCMRLTARQTQCVPTNSTLPVWLGYVGCELGD